MALKKSKGKSVSKRKKSRYQELVGYLRENRKIIDENTSFISFPIAQSNSYGDLKLMQEIVSSIDDRLSKIKKDGNYLFYLE